MTQLAPYLHFNGNCKEAMTFYRDCLGGKLDLQIVGDSPAAASMPKEAHNQVMHSVLDVDGFQLMASDMFDASEVVRGNAFSMTVICKDKAEVDALFNKLAAGGTVTDPVKEEFFGTFGALTDKFGVRWMFQANKQPAQV